MNSVRAHLGNELGVVVEDEDRTVRGNQGAHFLAQVGDGGERKFFGAELDQIDTAEDELFGDEGDSFQRDVAGVDYGVEARAGEALAALVEGDHAYFL